MDGFRKNNPLMIPRQAQGLLLMQLVIKKGGDIMNDIPNIMANIISNIITYIIAYITFNITIDIIMDGIHPFKQSSFIVHS
jgi:hypothetical protein